ncbi:TetR/AcrR family transcriptional regulator [Streptomyces sp. NPDC005438]|uniref:TetR/AcrR family transcriptional regulator n=1 Tax=Streptomyces sp. NPDC005438 TaxID=3156880 RepID=UPI0033B9C476
MSTDQVRQTSGARSTAEAQRARVVRAAVGAFARTGYHATPVTEVASAAGISPAYVFRLFRDKLGLFVAALEHCHERVRTAVLEGADRAEGDSPEEVLSAMGQAYAELIADRDLMMLQVHAQSACEVPEIRQAVQRGLGGMVEAVRSRSGAEDVEVQRFMATGQLCHLIVTTGLERLDEPWVGVLTAGIRHVEPVDPEDTAP